MYHYYVNKNQQSNGDNEVHKQDCSYLPNAINREYLGYYSNCKEAVLEAKKKYARSNGCYYCSNECHTS